MADRYEHVHAQGTDHCKEIKGENSGSMRHGMPEKLLGEILDAALRTRKGSTPGRGTVIDLCAGNRSMQGPATERGFDYVAVDWKTCEAAPECRRLVGACLVNHNAALLVRERHGQWEVPTASVDQRQGRAYWEAQEKLWSDAGIPPSWIATHRRGAVQCRHDKDRTWYVQHVIGGYAVKPGWRWMPREEWERRPPSDSTRALWRSLMSVLD